MIRFLHSADWHWGRQPKVSDETSLKAVCSLERTILHMAELAHERNVDFVLVAGDIFESNDLPDEEYQRFAETMKAFHPLQVHLISGNHDPANEQSVWTKGFPVALPENIHIHSEPTVVSLCQGRVSLLIHPLKTERSKLDPTATFSNYSTPQEAIRIGLTHGSLMLDDLGKPDEHPIPIDVIEKHRLDYLALGHWHSWFDHAGRIVYPGVLQPWSKKGNRGLAALVEIDAPGELPRIVPVTCAVFFP